MEWPKSASGERSRVARGVKGGGAGPPKGPVAAGLSRTSLEGAVYDDRDGVRVIVQRLVTEIDGVRRARNRAQEREILIGEVDRVQLFPGPAPDEVEPVLERVLHIDPHS